MGTILARPVAARMIAPAAAFATAARGTIITRTIETRAFAAFPGTKILAWTARRTLAMLALLAEAALPGAFLPVVGSAFVAKAARLAKLPFAAEPRFTFAARWT